MPGDDVAFLRWALPHVGLRAEAFHRVKRQAWRRIERRRRALGLPDAGAYRRYLEEHPEEWPYIDEACRITISRVARDRVVWDALVGDVLPRLAAGGPIRAWSAGCGAGEEPYTLAIAAAFGGIAIEIVATDVNEGQLARARVGCYPDGALRELPPAWRDAAFASIDGLACLREPYRHGVRFEVRDVRGAPPEGPFELVLCRNLAFSYLDDPHQRAVAASIHASLRPGGVLVVGLDEVLPAGTPGFAPIGPCLYSRECET
jgi:chemotaxis protein methyltransferase CheR